MPVTLEHRHRLPAFPTEVLPAWLRDFVESLSEATQTPRDLAGMLAIAVLGVANAKKFAIEVRRGWIEPLTVFVVVTLPPANRKSAVFSAVTSPVVSFEREEATRLAPEIAEIQSSLDIATARLKRAERDAASANPDEQEACAREAAELARTVSEMRVPVPPRLITEDVTPEKLVGLLAEQGGRMALLSPEGGIFDLMAGRYGDGAPNFEVYLKAHAGDPLWVDRMTRSQQIQSPALTIGLTVQPEVIRGLALKPGFRGKGLLARFLYSLPESLVGRREIAPPPVPLGLTATYEGKLAALLSRKGTPDAHGELVPALLKPSQAAQSAIKEFEHWLEPRLAPSAELGPLNDWGGKLAGAVARIAALLHLAKHGADERPTEVEVSAESVLQGIAVGKYLVHHARAAFEVMGADQGLETARHLVRWFKRYRQDQQTVTRREMYRELPGRDPASPLVDEAVELLVEHHYLRPVAQEREGPGRRSEVYAINPRLWATDSQT